jgi:hypothetical protein
MAPTPTPRSNQTTSTTPTIAVTPTCSLPIWLYDWSASGNRGSGHFLRGSSLTQAQPSDTSGDAVAAYVASVQRWLPVPATLLAPDGRRYAYNDASGNPEVDRVHVVDLASGADRVIAQGDAKTGYEALDFEGDGLYAGRPAQGPGTPAGLWRLDPQAGTVTLVDGTRRWQWISRGYAYAIIPNPTDPVAVQGGPVADTMLRLDLGTRQIEQWLHHRGEGLVVRGFDWEGHPVLSLGSTLADLAVVTGKDAVQPLAGGSREVTFSYVYRSLVADPAGFWLGADQGVVRYTAKGSFQLVWMNPTVKTVLPLVAGPCA